MTDEDLDERLHTWGAAQRADAPRAPFPAQGRPGATGRTFFLVGVTVAAVAAAIVSVAWFAQSWSGAGHLDSGQASESGPASLMTMHSTPKPGYRSVNYHGLTLDVPADWTQNMSMCDGPIGDTVQMPVMVAACGETLNSNMTTVYFAPTYDHALSTLFGNNFAATQTEVDGLAATRYTSPRLADGPPIATGLEVPGLRAALKIRAPSDAIAIELLSTVRIEAVDSNGCPTVATEVYPLPEGRSTVRQGLEGTILPDSPTSLLVCRYGGGRIDQSAVVPTDGISAFQTTLESLPEGLSVDGNSPDEGSCWEVVSQGLGEGGPFAPTSDAYQVIARYASGPNVVVTIRIDGCGALGASNGIRTGQLTPALAKLMVDLAGGAGWPSSIIPRSP